MTPPSNSVCRQFFVNLYGNEKITVCSKPKAEESKPSVTAYSVGSLSDIFEGATRGQKKKKLKIERKLSTRRNQVEMSRARFVGRGRNGTPATKAGKKATKK